MKKYAQKTMALVLLLGMVSSNALAAAPAGMLYASGTVNVNGMAVSRSTAVFEGDVLSTSGTSAGTVSYKGSSVMVNGNSTVTIAKGNISISSGSAAVQTTQGLMVQIGRVTVAPAAQNARFRVIHNGNSVTIGAMEQDLKINDGTKNIALQAGRSITIPFASTNASQPKQDDRKNAEAVSAEPQGTSSQGTAGTGGTTAEGGLTPGIIAVLTSGISSAITGAMMFTQSPATPVTP